VNAFLISASFSFFTHLSHSVTFSSAAFTVDAAFFGLQNEGHQIAENIIYGNIKLLLKKKL